MSDTDIADMGFKIFGILVLVIVILFILTWGGIMSCSQIPFFCTVYETVMGEPQVLIVYGDEGLGNPDDLKEILIDPRKVGLNQVDIAHIDTLSPGNLKKYALVIVTHSKVMSMGQLEMFIDFAQFGGGRLIWTGDAGTVGDSDELENLVDVNNSQLMLDNPWARAKETDTEYQVLNFDEFLGLRYIGNYCVEFNCTDKMFSPGIMKTELTGDHPLIFGFSALELKISKENDMAMVKQFPNASNSNIVMNLDMGSNKDGIENNFTRYVPLIATSGIGERVAYYAYPVETFCKDNNYPNACILLAKNMYYGMLGK